MTADVLLLVPFESPTGMMVDPVARQTLAGRYLLPLGEAISEFEEYLGRRIDFLNPERAPVFGWGPWHTPKHRSLTSVTLATHLERAGLRWKVFDPGTQELGYWRRVLKESRELDPPCVAVSTSFLMSVGWIRSLLATIREIFPRTKIVVGGYYYATNAQEFLSFDADVYCVGEGEVRFPEIVKRLRDGGTLDDIPGIYVRRPDGSLAHTGKSEPLNMTELPAIDWRLAQRIEPPVSIDADLIEMGLETQRGCVFKCSFCTYRTLASPSVMDADQVVERILATKTTDHGYINLTDATATFPHARWEDIMQRLVARGGSPHPIWAFARVSDITDENAALMSRANVKMLFVGQESADQRMLNLMRKGTKVSQIMPAVRALNKHGICANFGLIHGFPGETEESIQATRRMLATINDGFEGEPPVLGYTLGPFAVCDFAAVSTDATLQQDYHHYMSYDKGELTAERITDECLATIMQTSRIHHAPVSPFVFGMRFPLTTGVALGGHPRRYELFRFMKDVERGAMIFLEREVMGTRPNALELRRLKKAVLACYPAVPFWKAPLETALAHVNTMFLRRLRKEWTGETKAGIGLLTRPVVGLSAYRDTGSLTIAAKALVSGTYDAHGSVQKSASPVDGEDRTADLAKELVGEAAERARRKKSAPVAAPDEALVTLSPGPRDGTRANRPAN